MKCVVCTRPGETVKLANLFKQKCCGSCKTAYYRALTKLHEHVNDKTKRSDEIELLDLRRFQELTWDFLCTADLCTGNRVFDSTVKLCPINFGTTYSSNQCAHCRFRKTFFIFKNLAWTNSKIPRVNQISAKLFRYSKAIVEYCVSQMSLKRGGIDWLTEERCPESTNAQQKEYISLINNENPVVMRQLVDIKKAQFFKLNLCLDNLSRQDEMHYFIRSPKNPEATEWMMGVVKDENSTGSILEFFARSDGKSQELTNRRNWQDYTVNLFSFMLSYYANHYFVNNVILRNMLQHVNHEYCACAGYNEMLTNLSIKINAFYKGINVYLTALGSWFDGYMYYINNTVDKYYSETDLISTKK